MGQNRIIRNEVGRESYNLLLSCLVHPGRSVAVLLEGAQLLYNWRHAFYVTIRIMPILH